MAKERPRLGRNGQVYTPYKTQSFEKNLQSMFKYIDKQFEPLNEALHMDMTFCYVKPKSVKKGIKYKTSTPDLDNLVKACSDALQGFIYENDSRIVSESSRKIYWLKDGILIRVTPLNDLF